MFCVVSLRVYIQWHRNWRVIEPGPRVEPQNVKWRTCTVHAGFSVAGEVILTQKAPKPLVAGVPHWGAYIAPQAQ